jgi:membrane-bound lytic murein transglycosylase D
MFTSLRNIFVILILFSNSILINAEIQKSDFEHLQSMCSHANKLVRDNQYDTALYFYDSIFEYIDSIESGIIENTTAEYDSLIENITNHYTNFEKLVSELEVSFDSEDKLSCYDKKDFNLINIDSFHTEFQPFPQDTESKKIKKWIDFYTQKRRDSAQMYLDRSTEYIDDVKKIFRHFNLPEDLAYIPLAESGFSPFAHSFAKAIGLWQFIPSTGRVFGLNSNWWEDERKNVIKSTIAAAQFYMYLYNRLNDWDLVLAGYNCGHVRILKSIKKHKTNNFWSLHSLPKETKDYVPRVRALISIGKEPEKYGFAVEKELFRHDTVMLDSCVNLNVIALSAGINYEEIKRLNPHLRQWCLPPYSKDYSVVIPAHSKIRFRENYSKYSIEDKYPVSSYKVKKGDSVEKISEKFKINPEGVTDLNELTKNKLIPGQVIKVLEPPVKEAWFNDFNKKYLTYNDGEEYYKGGKKRIIYKVKNGDNLSVISQKHKIKLAKLKAWNKIGKDNKILTGQNLVIYL